MNRPASLPDQAQAPADWRRWEFWAVAAGIWTLLGFVRILSVVGSIRAQACPLTEGMVGSYTLFDYGLWLLLAPVMFTMASWVRIEPGNRIRGMALHGLAALTLGMVHLSLFITLYAAYNLGRKPHLADLPLGFKLLGSDHLYMSILVYAGTVTVALVLHHRRQQASAAMRAAALEVQLGQAELMALRMQLQPHFLFNTLHTIGALVDENPALARRMTARLGDFLRLTLESSHAPEVTLGQELAFVRHYLEIERIRFGSRLMVFEDVDQALTDALVPNLILQPLIENALRHGLSRLESGGTLTYSAERLGNVVRLQVKDTGSGLPAHPIFGIGLANVARRLSQLYGQDGQLALEPGQAGGTIATVTLPLRFGEVL